MHRQLDFADPADRAIAAQVLANGQVMGNARANINVVSANATVILHSGE